MIVTQKLLNLFKRPPDMIIGGTDNPYLKRWYVIPRNRFFNIYLHHFLRSDDDRALHDHPWWNMSILLKGSYLEVVPKHKHMWPHNRDTLKILRAPGRLGIVFRPPEAAHRVQLLRRIEQKPHTIGNVMVATEEIPVWTLFITGPRLRDWGFWCPHGWRHWQDFTSNKDGVSETGKGCE